MSSVTRTITSCVISSIDSYKKVSLRFRVNCALSNSVASNPYTILRIHPGASKSDVKKAFKQLALKYHPDVCKGTSDGIEFHQINEAYDMVMNNFKDTTSEYTNGSAMEMDELVRDTDEPDWELWEEWMGWEGAGIRDYSSHINPYI
uniref:chaperone protein dnaJ 8, chloroplastic-like n=1 Tax=Erigeron canadensis TaxID=72917 RepID=UPI001CB979D1|nr:chaperone protein dnaJ 8, chloroplastic-like [Erigeron canadensis]